MMKNIEVAGMFARVLSVLFAAVIVAGCSAPSVKTANRPVGGTNMVGPESEAWDTPYRLISGKSPIYPISELFASKQGRSVIIYTIGTDGKARDFLIESTSDKRYADHAIIAVREWVFQPAMKDGSPVEARVRQAFDFELD